MLALASLPLVLFLGGILAFAGDTANRNTPPVPPLKWERMPLLSPESAKAGITPGGEGGQWPRGAVVIAPSDPDFLLLPIDVGGLYRSLDAGKNWEIATVGWSARGANCLAIDPRNPQRVIGVAGNGDDWGKTWGPSPNGIYLSTNKAASWKHVLAFRDGKPADAVAFDPTSYDATRGYCTIAYVASSHVGLLKSTDGGETWTKISDQAVGRNPGANQPPFLAVHPTKGWIFLAGKGGLFRSEDGGKSFTVLREGDVWGLSLPDGSVGPDRVYISGSDGLFVSEDAGKTFSPLVASGVDRQNGSKPVRDVTVSPADAKRLTCWVQGDNYKWVRYISHDSGATFTPIDIQKGQASLPYNVRQGWFAWHPKNPDLVYGLGGDWVTRSTDGGKTFTWYNNGYNGVMTGGLFNFSAQSPNTVFLGFQDYNGAFTGDGGRTWNYRDVSGKGWGGHEYGAFTPDGRVMYAGDADDWGGKRHLRISQDGGATWQTVNGPDGKPLEFHGPDVSCADPTDTRILFASDLRSSDGGKTWERMTNCDGVFTFSPGTKILFGKKAKTVVCSSDRGNTWETVADIPGGFSDLAVDHRTGRIYAASEGKLKVWENSKWFVIDVPTDQRGNARVATVAVDPKATDVLYIGASRDVYNTHTAVCRSTDGGRTWRNLTVTTPLTPGVSGGPHEVSAIRVHPVTREAWVAGQCFGMWRVAPPAPGEMGLSATLASAPKAPTPPLMEDVPLPTVVTSSARITVRNGGMEEGGVIPTGWEAKWEGKGHIKVTRDTTVHHSGAASLCVASDGGNALGQAAQYVEAPAGAKLVLRGWVKSQGSVKVNVAAQPVNASYTPLTFIQARYLQNDAAWTEFSKEITMPSGSNRLAVVLLLDGEGKAWLDDVRIDSVNLTEAKADPDTSPTPEVQNPTVPIHGYWPDHPSDWLGFHRQLVEGAKKANPQIVFLGDSITQGWSGAGKAEWDARFAPKGAFNGGIGGDRTQQILWRIDHGILDGVHPKLVVLAIGVNNLWRDVSKYGVSGVADGVSKIVKAVQTQCPEAKVLIIGIFPTQQDATNPLRKTVKEVNALYAKLDDGKKVSFVDIGPQFLEPDGSLTKETTPDYLHLSPKGYRIYAEALGPAITNLLK